MSCRGAYADVATGERSLHNNKSKIGSRSSHFEFDRGKTFDSALTTPRAMKRLRSEISIPPISKGHALTNQHSSHDEQRRVAGSLCQNKFDCLNMKVNNTEGNIVNSVTHVANSFSNSDKDSVSTRGTTKISWVSLLRQALSPFDHSTRQPSVEQYVSDSEKESASG